MHECKEGELKPSSQTGQLWLQYQNMLRICRKFIASDRTGSWDDHMTVTAEALSIFPAAGHFNYLKSAYLYLQRIVSLSVTNPAADKFLRGGFPAIRRSDRFWAGLDADLVIEQSLDKIAQEYRRLNKRMWYDLGTASTLDYVYASVCSIQCCDGGVNTSWLQFLCATQGSDLC